MFKTGKKWKARAAFFDTAHESFLILDEYLNFIDVSDAFLLEMKLTREQVIGMNIREFSPGIEDTDRYQKYLTVLKTGIPCFIDEIHLHPRWGKHIVRVHVFKIGEGLGIASLNITDLRDKIVELDNTRQKLRAANYSLQSRNQDLHRLSCITAHDLKLPVQNIRFLLDELKTTALPETVQPVFQKMDDLVDLLLTRFDLLNEVMNNGNWNTQHHEYVDLLHTLNQIKVSMPETILRSKVQIESDFSACPRVPYNPLQMQSIMHNLIKMFMDGADNKGNGSSPLFLKSEVEGSSRVLTFEGADNRLWSELAVSSAVPDLDKYSEPSPGKGNMCTHLVRSIVLANGGKIEKLDHQANTTLKLYLS